MTVALRVQQVQRHGPHVVELCLDREGYVFQPGDCAALFGPDGRVSRPYSIASGTSDPCLSFLVREMPGGEVSPYLAALRAGDRVAVSPPFGWFRPGEHAALRPFVCLATGTGIAPFRAMLRSAPALLPAALFYGVRAAADLVEPDWLRQRAGALLAVSREHVPGTHHGRITGLLDGLDAGPDADYYLCGLDAMIDEVSERLEARGVPIQRVHRECFFNAAYGGG